MKRLILYIAGLIFLAGCSTTKHLPEGEILYTGQKPMIVLNRSETSVGEIAMEEVEAALATAPNNSLLGSSTIRYPFPFGLWIYNGFQKYEKGFQRKRQLQDIYRPEGLAEGKVAIYGEHA